MEPLHRNGGDILEAAAFGPNGHLFIVRRGGDILETQVSQDQGDFLGVFASQNTLPSGSNADALEIAFKPRLGDANRDWTIDASDAAGFAARFTTNGILPFNYNCLTFDFDRDQDVDCADWVKFRKRAAADGNIVPPLATCGVPGDADTNGVLDLADFAALQACFSGEGFMPAGGECLALFDTDADGDVDMIDAGARGVPASARRCVPVPESRPGGGGKLRRPVSRALFFGVFSVRVLASAWGVMAVSCSKRVVLLALDQGYGRSAALCGSSQVATSA